MKILIDERQIFVGQTETKSDWAMAWAMYQEFPKAYDFDFETKDNKRALAAKDPSIWIILLEP